MAERVRADRLVDLRQLYRSLYCSLQATRVQMMTADDATARVGGDTVGGKDVLPGKLFISVRIFAPQDRASPPSHTLCQVAGVKFLHKSILRIQWSDQAGGQHRQAVLFALAFPNDHLGLIKVNVFYPQAQAMHQAQAATVEQVRHQLVQPIQFVQHLTDFVFGKHRWQVLGRFGAQGVNGCAQLDVQDIAVQEQQSVENLVLGGGRNIALLREVGEKGFDLRRAHLCEVAGETLFHVIEEAIALRPMDIGFLGGIGIVLEADGVTQLVEQFLGFGGGLIGRGRWLF